MHDLLEGIGPEEIKLLLTHCISAHTLHYTGTRHYITSIMGTLTMINLSQYLLHPLQRTDLGWTKFNVDNVQELTPYDS